MESVLLFYNLCTIESPVMYVLKRCYKGDIIILFFLLIAKASLEQAHSSCNYICVFSFAIHIQMHESEVSHACKRPLLRKVL